MADDQEQHGKSHAKHGGGHGPPHGGGAHEEHEGAPEWLISFADNVTLMMGFFVILLAMNMGPKGAAASGAGEKPGEGAPQQAPEMLDWVIAVREAFNNPVDINSANPRELPLVQRLLERAGLDKPPTAGPRGRAEEMQSIRPSQYYHLCGSIPFDDHSAALAGPAREIFDEIVRHLRGLRVLVEVRGHVSAAEAYAAPDRGMKLSFERAMTVAEALARSGLEWRQLRVISCGDSDRVKAPAYDPAGQRRNQRVEVVVTDALMPDPDPVPAPAASAAPSPAPAAAPSPH